MAYLQALWLFVSGGRVTTHCSHQKLNTVVCFFLGSVTCTRRIYLEILREANADELWYMQVKCIVSHPFHIFVTYLCVALMRAFWCWCKSDPWPIAMGQVSTCHCLTLRFSMARPKPKSFEKSRAIFEFSLYMYSGNFCWYNPPKVVFILWGKFTGGIYQDMFFFQFLWSFDSMSILLVIGREGSTGQIIFSDSS